MTDLPLLGAALYLQELSDLPGMTDFVRDAGRDIEIRDFTGIGALSGNAWPDIADRARAALRGHAGRIGIHGPFWGIAVDTPDLDVRRITQDRLDAGLSALIRVLDGRGGGHMVVHSPYTTWHGFNRWTNQCDAAGILERTLATLGPAVRKAEENGIEIVLENCEDRDPAERVALAAAFGSPALRVSVDTGHAHYAHGSTGAPPVDAFIRAAGPALAHVHLQDADGVADRHWRIGQGNILWPGVFAAIAGLPVRPRLILEMADARDVIPSARWLEGQGLAA
ncbi:MAG: sugar phosphate isomerase/epimerase [Rhodobacteraceae bacterium]|nr:sugar phosphate isomerase/epimerase [Paracoccaceae bacterium]